MSEEEKVVKKRGRPKKAAEVESIVVIDTSSDGLPDLSTTKAKRSNGRKAATKPSETEVTPRKRVSKKTGSKSEDEAVTPQVIKARTSAKNSDNVSTTLEKTVSSSTQASAPSRSDGIAQAHAPRDIWETTTIEDKSEVSKDNPQLTTSSSTLELTQSPSNAHSMRQSNIESVQTGLTNVTSAIRQLSLDRAEVSLSRLSNELKHSTDSVSSLLADLKHRAELATRFQELQAQVTDAETAIQGSTLGVQAALQNRRAFHFSSAESQLVGLASQAQTLSSTISIIRSRRQAERETTIRTLGSCLETLNTSIQDSAALVQQHKLVIQQSVRPASETQPQPQPHPQIAMQSQSQSRFTPSSAPSTSTSPNSQPQPTHQPLQPRVQPNPQPTPTPRPPRPTELPYDELRKNPTFKRESRKWTGLIVGIPVLVATSWVLYKRHQDTLRARFLPEDKGRMRGELPPNTSGVKRSSDVGFNGGV